MTLPPVLSVNAMVSSSEVFEVWRDCVHDGKAQHYLPPKLSLRLLPDGDLAVGEGDGSVTYVLRVSQISQVVLMQSSRLSSRSTILRITPHTCSPS